MRVLLFSDVHNNVTTARRLATWARSTRVDGLLSAGDLALHDEHDPEMYEAFASAGVPVWSVPGNHDGDEPYREVVERYGWNDLDGRVVRVGATWLAGWGLRYSYKPYYAPDPVKQEEDPVLELIAGQLQGRTGRMALVSHVPPYGTRTSLEKGRSRGNAQLRRIIEAHWPAYALCGHVHHDRVVEDRLPGGTMVINAGPHGHLLELG